MKPINFVSFPGYLVGLPSMGTATLSNSAFDDGRLQVIALRLSAMARNGLGMDRAAAAPVPAAKAPKRK